MTPEEKQLLLKDLCARLPYGVKAHTKIGTNITVIGIIDDIVKDETEDSFDISLVKPYFRPMSSMTEEEWLKLKEWILIASDTKGRIYFDGFRNISAEDTIKVIDYLTSHHFDYRGLIEKGLALEASEGMYKTE